MQTRALAERKGISVSIEVEACGNLTADRHQIERVVLNLLANAIKFTSVGGTVTARLQPHGAGQRVEIFDTGEGIPIEALPRIFERLYQANLTSKAKRGGVGIGLSLCKRIVELHGGHIDVRSELGRGTTVGFWLPLCTAAAASATAALAGPAEVVAGEKGMPEWDQALRERSDYRFFGIQEVAERRAMPRSEVKNDGPSILVVDDNRDMVDFMLSILGADHQAWAAADGEEGLRLARRHRPELIVSDLVMPNMSGFDFLRAVRGDPDLATSPFVLLTARGGQDDRRLSDEAQADAFLPKPFSPATYGRSSAAC